MFVSLQAITSANCTAFPMIFYLPSVQGGGEIDIVKEISKT